MKKINFLVLFFSLCLVLMVPAHATTNKFSSFDLWPSGDKYFFTLSSTENLYGGEVFLGLNTLYSWRSLEARNANGTFLRAIVDDTIAHVLSAAVGVTDYLQVGISWPFFSLVNFTQPAGGLPNTTSMELGDLRFAARLRLVNSDKSRHGLSLEPFITVPLNGDDVYVGDGNLVYGGLLNYDVWLGRRVKLALNTGAEFRERVILNNIDFHHRLIGGIGLHTILGKGFAINNEVRVKTPVDDIFASGSTTPVDILNGLKWDVGQSPVSLNLAAGTCASCGTQSARFKGLAGIEARFGSSKLEEKKEKSSQSREALFH